MITHHQYISSNPIDPESKTLILGTIHPHDVDSFQLPFFYGNRNSIWKLLSDAFPGEMSQPLSVTGIESFLEARKIGISDTVLRCRRLNPTALDKNMIPEELNHALVNQIRDSQIDTILCTSGFGKNNAFRLFFQDILKLKITSEIRRSREAVIDRSVFGRTVNVKALYSPAGTANISLSRHPEFLANKHTYLSRTPVQEFKVQYYRNQFMITQ